MGTSNLFDALTIAGSIRRERHRDHRLRDVIANAPVNAVRIAVGVLIGPPLGWLVVTVLQNTPPEWWLP